MFFPPSLRQVSDFLLPCTIYFNCSNVSLSLPEDVFSFINSTNSEVSILSSLSTSFVIELWSSSAKSTFLVSLKTSIFLSLITNCSKSRNSVCSSLTQIELVLLSVSFLMLGKTNNLLSTNSSSWLCGIIGFSSLLSMVFV